MRRDRPGGGGWLWKTPLRDPKTTLFAVAAIKFKQCVTFRQRRFEAMRWMHGGADLACLAARGATL
jgi:hypothetical protein